MRSPVPYLTSSSVGEKLEGIPENTKRRTRQRAFHICIGDLLNVLRGGASPIARLLALKKNKKSERIWTVVGLSPRALPKCDSRHFCGLGNISRRELDSPTFQRHPGSGKKTVGTGSWDFSLSRGLRDRRKGGCILLSHATPIPCHSAL